MLFVSFKYINNILSSIPNFSDFTINNTIFFVFKSTLRLISSEENYNIFMEKLNEKNDNSCVLQTHMEKKQVHDFKQPIYNYYDNTSSGFYYGRKKQKTVIIINTFDDTNDTYSDYGYFCNADELDVY